MTYSGTKGETPDTDKAAPSGLPRQLSTLPGDPLLSRFPLPVQRNNGAPHWRSVHVGLAIGPGTDTGDTPEGAGEMRQVTVA
jgi:hypothetical protein